MIAWAKTRIPSRSTSVSSSARSLPTYSPKSILFLGISLLLDVCSTSVRMGDGLSVQGRKRNSTTSRDANLANGSDDRLYRHEGGSDAPKTTAHRLVYGRPDIWLQRPPGLSE